MYNENLTKNFILLEDGERPRKRPRPSTPTSDDDDSSWNLMGAALEREFLAQD